MSIAVPSIFNDTGAGSAADAGGSVACWMGTTGPAGTSGAGREGAFGTAVEAGWVAVVAAGTGGAGSA
ncbi:hypothetical protein, partial [Escherichia coli]|uniref:hypothetical protein n=1 Tax=Escherichia coli TaxID=562 RepID=UPI0032E44612